MCNLYCPIYIHLFVPPTKKLRPWLGQLGPGFLQTLHRLCWITHCRHRCQCRGCRFTCRYRCMAGVAQNLYVINMWLMCVYIYILYTKDLGRSSTCPKKTSQKIIEALLAGSRETSAEAEGDTMGSEGVVTGSGPPLTGDPEEEGLSLLPPAPSALSSS